MKNPLLCQARSEPVGAAWRQPFRRANDLVRSNAGDPLMANVACDIFSCFAWPAISRSPFGAFLITGGIRPPAQGVLVMTGLVRAISLCAMLALGLVHAQAADKAFRRDDLADSA